MAKNSFQKKAKKFRNFRNKSCSILMLHKIDKKKICPNVDIVQRKIILERFESFLTLKNNFENQILTAIFGHSSGLMKKSIPFLWSVKTWPQSEKFLSNSVDMMKNLPWRWRYTSNHHCPIDELWWFSRHNLLDSLLFDEFGPLHRPLPLTYCNYVLPEIWKNNPMLQNQLSRSNRLPFLL